MAESTPPKAWTPEKIEARDYTYCQAFIGDDVDWSSHYFLVGSPFTAAARVQALAYCQYRWGAEPRELYLYPRNYVREARSLLARGDYPGGGA